MAKAAAKTSKPAAKAAKPAAKKPAAKDASAKTKVETVSLRSIATDLAEAHELSKKQANAILDDFVAHVAKLLKKGSKVRLSGLGMLQVRKRAARMGRNPATGEAIKIKASKKVAFRVAKELKESI